MVGNGKMNPSSEAEEGGVKSLLKWAAKYGIEVSESCSSLGLGHCLGVSCFPGAGGRGVDALRPISKGELLLKVPKSALITTDSLLSRDETLSLALKAHPSLSSTQVDYAIWAAQKAVTKAKYEWEQAFTLMKELMLKPPLLTFRAWIWATGTISSRTLHIPWDEAGCLCPVGDLFNYAAPTEDPDSFENVENWQNEHAKDDLDIHHSQRLTDGGYEEDVAAYCFYAKKNYNVGEQVLLSYGTYTNLELLEYYGFLLEDNPNEKVFIPLDLDMHSLSCWPKESLYIHQNGRPSFALMCALRLWATPPQQRKSIGHLAYSGCPISKGNEIYVMKWIGKKCDALLKEMPTSVEEDKSLVHLIDKMEEYENLGEWVKEASAVSGSEFGDNNILKAAYGVEGDDELTSLVRTKMLIDRWKLAVQWRLMYKTVVARCISYCTDIINSLSTQ
ncbi:protein SET DOMAIN GROUP 40 isoform X2 [Gossypium australe]|uniref:Protein SET DOMAIN GROUP 40 isoform X2 n=1 Tax=Gossypium australe TaxID=47621 RepID=A0A5B6UVM2_9ROSI|nr:protein SET DOMAIN GROUP 40 isoform X2 [Gossypium australe]